VKLRLDPSDEHMHPLEAESNFNESMYFNVFDSEANLGGFFRLGNRANEGKAEMTTCLYLPDGRVAFMFNRPAIEHNDAFDAGGMRFEVVEPFEELKVRYEGKVVILDDPLAMADPRTAFKENPWAECRAELTFRGISPVYGGEPVNDDGSPIPESGEGFARGHYEQHTAGTGTITVGDQSWAIDGLGLRGLRIGSAEVSPKHANFIQADPGGSADDVKRLMDEVARRVADATGVTLHAETRLVGFSSPEGR